MFSGFSDAIAPRVHSLNGQAIDGSAPDGKPPAYVLCWLQQALRAADNPVIDAAIEIGNALRLPVLVYNGLRADYPHASDRLHRFIVGASRDLQRDAKARGLRAVTFVETPDAPARGLLYRLSARAAAVLTDENFCFVTRWQTARFAARADVPVLAVDAARVVPTRALPDTIRVTISFRKHMRERRDDFLDQPADFEPAVAPFDGDLPFADTRLAERSDADLDRLTAACAIDHTLPASADFPASAGAAEDRLQRFAARSIARYAEARVNPSEPDGASSLSPYLHFGVIGPRHVARTVLAADAPAESRQKFLDEMITWREWFHYLAHHAAEPESFAYVPERPRLSLLAHAGDPREQIYPLDALVHGETDDETWNACQRQWLATGWMHNNLRMYWGKQVIGWTPDPQTAWATCCYLNDRFSLDGRDPSTYGNMRWVFGDARPSFREQPVYGRVEVRRDKIIRKREGMTEWIAASARRATPRVAVPDALPQHYR